MIQIKRLPITFFALIALFGVISCVAIEPALAQLDSHDHHSESTEAAPEHTDGHCDFICHPSHHLWTAGSDKILINQQLQSLGSVVQVTTEFSDPPLKGIFHPPAVLT